HRGRLARSVRADKSEHVPLFELQIDLVDGDQVAVALGQLVGFNHGRILEAEGPACQGPIFGSAVDVSRSTCSTGSTKRTKVLASVTSGLSPSMRTWAAGILARPTRTPRPRFIRRVISSSRNAACSRPV